MFRRGTFGPSPLPALAGGVVLGVLSVGCHGPAAPLFPPPKDALAWPPPPKPARVLYLGEIRTAADLHPAESTFAGIGRFFAGEETPAPLYGPRAVVTTPDGRWLWVADPGGRCVHGFDLVEREYTRIQAAGEQPLLTPVGICLGPDDSLFVCDSEAIAVHRFSAKGGSWIETLTLPEDMGRPVAAFYSEGRDTLFVVDAVAHDVKALSLRAGTVATIGRRGTGAGEFNFPCDVTGDDRVLWVADTGNQRVQCIGQDGVPIATIGEAGDTPGTMALPKCVALDRDGHVYVVDARFENAQIFDRNGRLLLYFGSEGRGPGEFWLPSGIHIDRLDRIWICDTYNHRIQVFQYVSREE